MGVGGSQVYWKFYEKLFLFIFLVESNVPNSQSEHVLNSVAEKQSDLVDEHLGEGVVAANGLALNCSKGGDGQQLKHSVQTADDTTLVVNNNVDRW